MNSRQQQNIERFKRLLPHIAWHGHIFSILSPISQQKAAKTIKLELIEKETSNHQVIDLQLIQFLWEVGVALTPAYNGGDLRAGFAIVRYFPFLKESPQGGFLELSQECSDIDPRLKAVMAEELGIGAACYTARKEKKIDFIIDVFTAQKAGFVVINKINGNKRPDFCGLTNQDKLIFFESKGTVVSKKSMSMLASKGKLQVQNVDSPLLNVERRLAFSTFFATSNSAIKDQSTCLILDPPEFDDKKNDVNALDLLIRCYFAKICRFASNDALADIILDQENPLDEWDNLIFEQSPVELIGLDPFGNGVIFARQLFERLTNRSLGLLTPEIIKQLTVADESIRNYADIELAPGIGLIWLKNSPEI